jgi:hypothetical protein
VANVTRISTGGSQQVALETRSQNLTREKGPTTQQATTGFINWAGLQNVLGQPFSQLQMPFQKLYEMRRDPMIAFGLQYVKVPLIRAPWYIKCTDAQVAAFVDNALRTIYGPLILDMTNALDFGFSPMEKRFENTQPKWTFEDPESQQDIPVWASGPVKALVWKAPVPIPPEAVVPLWSATGEFDGFEWNGRNSLGFYHVINQGDNALIDIDHALWFTNERHTVFNSLWGYPRIAYAHRYWWSYWFRWALADRAFEKHSDPAMLIYYPDDKVVDDATGQDVNIREVAARTIEAVRSGATVTLPNTRITSPDGSTVQGPEWEIKPIETNAQFQAYTESFNYLDVMKLRSIMVPEKSLIEAQGGGGYNVASEMGDMFYESQAVLMSEIDDHINRFMIPQLVSINFPERDVSVEKVTRGFAATDLELAKQLVQLIGQTDPSSLGVDVREVLKQSGVPTLSASQVAQKQQEAMAQAQAMQGDQGQGAPQGNPYAQGGNPQDQLNSNAAVGMGEFGPPDILHGYGGYADVIGGRYVARDRVLLGPAGLPAKRRIADAFRGSVFDDTEIVDATREIHDIWLTAYTDSYEQFADKLATARFAEGDRPDESPPPASAGGAGEAAAAAAGGGMTEKEAAATAKLLVARYDEVLVRAYRTAAEQSKPHVSTVVDKAGATAVKGVGLKPVVWNMDNPDVVAWMDAYGAQLVRNVTDTTRAEIRTFLASELQKTQDAKGIANAVRAHFAEFPSWKALRLARTEVAHAYNAATLLAGKMTGVKWVQASDASGGRNLKTDKPCIERNGKFYKIEDAPYEDFHPNGTLAWRLVPPGIAPPVGANLSQSGPLATFDPDEFEVRFNPSIDADEVQRYMTALAEHLGAEVI